MKKDTWYKRLGWTLFFGLITLLIFFILEQGFIWFGNAYNDNDYEASFVLDEYHLEGNILTLEIETDASKFYYDVWIDDINLNIEVKNQKSVTINLDDYEIELASGEHIIKSSFYGKNGISKYRESLITAKLIVE